jgi:DUF4097 and DUF4098 domain-containing protein YvlB
MGSSTTATATALRRRLLMIAGGAVTVAVIGLGSFVSVNAMAVQTVREKHVYRFDGSTLNLDLAIGDVQIVPGEPGKITVSRRLTYGLRRPEVEEHANGDTFVIRDRDCAASIAFQCRVRWLLQIPRSLEVNAVTAGGSISVSNVDGTLRLQSYSGRVNVQGAASQVLVLHSNTGSVTAAHVRSERVTASTQSGAVSLAFRAPPSFVYGRSENGQIGVVVPDGDETYRIRAESGNGSTTVTAHNDPSSPRRIDIESTSGAVSVTQTRDG